MGDEGRTGSSSLWLTTPSLLSPPRASMREKEISGEAPSLLYTPALAPGPEMEISRWRIAGEEPLRFRTPIKSSLRTETPVISISDIEGEASWLLMPTAKLALPVTLTSRS